MNYKKKFSDFKNLKVLITGSTGFKGAWLAYWLKMLGAKVVGVGFKPEKDSVLFTKLGLNKSIKQYFFDISKFSKLNSIIKEEKPDLIFHLAAQSIVSLSYTNPLATFNSNITGSANILESFRQSKAQGLIFITSDKCYLNLDKNTTFRENDMLGGTDNYSSSKACAENIFFSYLKSYFGKDNYLKLVSARAGNVIGGGDFKKDRIIPDIIRSISTNKKLIIRNPNATRPWQHVLEPLSGYLLLAHKILNKKINAKISPNWNFGPYKKNCKSVIYIVKKIQNYLKTKNIFKIVKNEKFHEPKLLSLNINKAKNELQWKPKLSLDQTLKLTANWYNLLDKNFDMKHLTEDQINFYSEKK